MKSRKPRREREDKENVPFSPVNKKLDFSFNCGLDNSSPPRSEHHVQFDIEIDRACADLTFALSEDSKVDSDHFSPCRTRQGITH